MSPSSDLQSQWSSRYLTETTLWGKKRSHSSLAVFHIAHWPEGRGKKLATKKKNQKNQRNGKNQTGSTATMKRLKWQDSKTGNSQKRSGMDCVAKLKRMFLFESGSSSFVLSVAVVLTARLALGGGADGGRKVQASPGHRLRLLHGDLDFGRHHVHYTFAHVNHLQVERMTGEESSPCAQAIPRS